MHRFIRAALVMILLVIALSAARAILTESEQSDERAFSRPSYLATYVSAEGDYNVQVRGDGSVIATERAVYDVGGHAPLPSWGVSTLAVLPLLEQPVAPLMGWGMTYMADIAARNRPLYYCLEERRAYDRANGTDTAAIGLRAVRAVLDIPFNVLPSTENCQQADLVLGANAESDCGNMGALGCAALLYDGARPYVRVTFNGTLVARGQLQLACVERGIDWHEIKHAFDLGHTGEYGGEGRRHPHRSDTGYMDAANCYPVDNQGATAPALEDWDDGSGTHRNRYGLERRDAAPPPTPKPSPLPSPTPRPWKFDPPPAGTPERYWFDVGFNHAWCRFVDPWNPECQ